MSPEEVWKRSKSYYIALQNSHPWGCPEYVLEPILQDGNKLSKWMPRSRKYKYLGAYPLHDSTVVLVRNLKNGNISLQFHLLCDEYFETVHAGEDQKPLVWSELITFQYFKSEYDDKEYVPNIDEECLDPAALEYISHQESHRQPKIPFQDE